MTELYVGSSSSSVEYSYSGCFKQGLRHGRGQITTPAGLKIDGEWRDGFCVRVDNLMLPDSSTYTGEVEPTKDCREIILHGNGNLVAPNQQYTFQGEFIRGNIGKIGKRILKDGTKYDGEWLDGKYHGKGELNLPNKNEYKGFFENGRPHGSGIFKRKHDSYEYDGFWINGIQEGKGKITVEGQLKYEGELVQGQYQGIGTAFYIDGSNYSGSFKGGVHHGEGTLKTKSGETFKGIWYQNKKQGLFEHTLPSGEIRTGEYQNELLYYTKIQIPKKVQISGSFVKHSPANATKLHGIGCVSFESEQHGILRYRAWFIDGDLKPSIRCEIFYSNGDIYKGDCSSQKMSGLSIVSPEGHGFMVYKSGWTYSGMFKKGQREGPGELEDKTNTFRLTGNWKNGCFCLGDQLIKVEQVWSEPQDWTNHRPPKEIKFKVKSDLKTVIWGGETLNNEHGEYPKGYGTLIVLGETGNYAVRATWEPSASAKSPLVLQELAKVGQKDETEYSKFPEIHWMHRYPQDRLQDKDGVFEGLIQHHSTLLCCKLEGVLKSGEKIEEGYWSTNGRFTSQPTNPSGYKPDN